MRILFAVLIFATVPPSRAADRIADPVPAGPTYDFGGKPVNDRVSTRPHLVPFDKSEWSACKIYEGKPLPANSQRMLYRHIVLSKLQKNGLKVLAKFRSDYMGYEDCLNGGVARPGSDLGNCGFKNKQARESLDEYSNWRGSLYIASLQFPHPKTMSDRDDLLAGERSAGLARNALPFGKSPRSLEPEEMGPVNRRIAQAKKKIVTNLLEEMKKEGTNCFRLDGEKVVRSDTFHHDGACYIKAATLREKAQRLFRGEARRQLAEDTAKIVAQTPWLAFMEGKANASGLNKGFESLAAAIQDGKTEIEEMTSGHLSQDQRIPLVASKGLVAGTLKRVMKDDETDEDRPAEIPLDQHRHFVCSAAQEIFAEFQAKKSNDQTALTVLGASGAVACVSSGLVPCILAGGATAITADVFRLKTLYADREANRHAFLAGHRELAEFKQTTADLESEIFQTYVLMPTGVAVPMALHGAFKLVRPTGKGIHP